MRIVHLDTASELRGGQHQLLLLARGLRGRGHQQLIVCPEASALEARALREKLQVFALPEHDPGHAYGTLELRRQLFLQPFDVLHAHDGQGQTIAWLASLGVRIRRVASRRVTFLPGRLAIHRWKYAGTCDGIIAVSQFVRGLLVSSGVPESKIEVIPDGIELPTQAANAQQRVGLRARWGFGAQEFLVGHVGAFTHEKGQDVALEAASILAEKLPEFRLLLAGDGPERLSAKIQNRVREARGDALLLGQVDDLSGFMDSLDLFIMPSRAEGLGSSALIAMAHGLAVVATRVGGLPEIVEEGHTGWLVPPESPAALAEAIAAAAADRRRLHQLGSNARERARQFSVDIMLERTESLYARILDREKSSGHGMALAAPKTEWSTSSAAAAAEVNKTSGPEGSV